jgi:hypothetical protein
VTRPIIVGIGILGAWLGIGLEEVFAQAVSTTAVNPDPAGASAQPPSRGPRLFFGPETPTIRRTSTFTEQPPVPSATVPPGPSAPVPATPPVPGAPVPPTTGTSVAPSPEGGGVPANESDISLPKSESAAGGGEPTTEAAAEEAAEAPAVDESKLLMNALGRADAPVKVYGWIQNSYTGNANGTPKNGFNFGVNPNDLANRWMGNQYYTVIENPLEQNDEVNFGFRFDSLFGHDWQFNHMRGMLDSAFQLNHFAGWDPAQFYAEVHLPWLTKGGIDFKGGRWYSILGYEVVAAIGRPLLSVPYMFNYGQPFTHTGMISTLHLTDRINIYNGAVNGWDRWINQNFIWNYIGGFTWTSKDGKANAAVSYIFGPEQYNRNVNNPQITLPGTTQVLNPGYLNSRVNIGYPGNSRFLFTTVLSYKWTDKLTQVIETDEGFENNIPGIGPGGSTINASWYSFGNWFLYSFCDKVTGVWRAEAFRDNNGVRTGFADNFYEQTVGLIYKPKPWLWIRPEARYDWAQFTHPYNDGTRNSQLTLAVDAILLY